MGRVVVTGAAGPVGRRVCAALADGTGPHVVAVDRERVTNVPPMVERVRADLTVDDLKPLLEGASTVVHLASSFKYQDDQLGAAATDLEATTCLLEAAGAVGVQHLVLVSSAMVYGAWATNPVPLTEAAPRRPNPEFAFAVVKAELERMGEQWLANHPGTVVTILRPTTALAEGETTWVASTLRSATLIDAGETDPPVQFLHLDDLAAAVALSVEQRLAGTYNVAPEGSIDGEMCRVLSGRVPRVRMPESMARRVTNFGWRHRLASIPPGIVGYTMHPWVVASDRLRDAGWEPTHTNAEAYVAGTPAKPWATLNAKRRQQLALGAAAIVTLGLAGVATWFIRRMRR